MNGDIMIMTNIIIRNNWYNSVTIFMNTLTDIDHDNEWMIS